MKKNNHERINYPTGIKLFRLTARDDIDDYGGRFLVVYGHGTKTDAYPTRKDALWFINKVLKEDPNYKKKGDFR